jgi:ketosteroid isomerase-like protein
VATGRAALQQAFSAFPPVGDVKLTAVDVVGTADHAVIRGVYSLNLMLPGATAAVADTGKFVELWRKQADGKWLISWDIWNSDIPLPAPASK